MKRKIYIIKPTVIRGIGFVSAGEVRDVSEADFSTLIECRKGESYDPAKHQKKGT